MFHFQCLWLLLSTQILVPNQTRPLLILLDLFIFPKSYQIHQSGGIKCIALANRRPNVIATASYDGTLILFGLKKGDGSETNSGNSILHSTIEIVVYTVWACLKAMTL